MHRQPQTPHSYDTDRVENDASNNSSIFTYILCRSNVFTELFPSNDKGIVYLAVS
jgi:hypothetical protein